jgi:hypothetical protein
MGRRLWTAPRTHSQETQTVAPNPVKVAELKMALRALYGDHVFWVTPWRRGSPSSSRTSFSRA